MHGHFLGPSRSGCGNRRSQTQAPGAAEPGRGEAALSDSAGGLAFSPRARGWGAGGDTPSPALRKSRSQTQDSSGPLSADSTFLAP